MKKKYTTYSENHTIMSVEMHQTRANKINVGFHICPVLAYFHPIFLDPPKSAVIERQPMIAYPQTGAVFSELGCFHIFASVRGKAKYSITDHV
jgi:hypothetical protein